MRYLKIAQDGIGLASDNYFVQSEYVDGATNVVVRHRFDYSLLWSKNFNDELFLSAIIDQSAILYNYVKPGYHTLDLTSGEITYTNNDLTPEYKWVLATLFLDRKENTYKCFHDNGDLLFELNSTFPVVDRWHKSGIIQFFNAQKSNNWIRCIGVGDGTEKWKIEYPWELVRVEGYNHLLILEYHAYEKFRQDEEYVGQRHWSNPDRYVIVIDAEKGKELWRKQVSYSKLDNKYGVMLGDMDGDLFEFDLESGAIKTNTKVTPRDSTGYVSHFVNNDSIYYTKHSGSFGRIRKKDGFVEWEFDVLDANGKKRELSDWFLLGNGNLLLQAKPGREGASFICVLNPDENLEFSKIKDGVRTQ